MKLNGRENTAYDHGHISNLFKFADSVIDLELVKKKVRGSVNVLLANMYREIEDFKKVIDTTKITDHELTAVE